MTKHNVRSGFAKTPHFIVATLFLTALAASPAAANHASGHYGNDHAHFNDDFLGHDTTSVGPPVGSLTRRSRDGSDRCGIGAGTLLGAALGGLIGAQFGSGTGQLAATGAGVLVGGAVGNRADCPR